MGGGKRRPVGMDDMNKTPAGGVGEIGLGCGAVKKRIVKSAVRRNTISCGEDTSKIRKDVKISIHLGKGAGKELLSSRACPLSQSPKRVTPMDIDVETPTMKRKKREYRKKSNIDGNQKLITDVWWKKSQNEKND